MASILIVEDDIDIAQGIAEFLEVKNHELDFAYNGKQAMSLLSQNQYQLVLLDINLPFIDGFDVCRSMLTQHLTHTPVIIMSARSSEQDVLKGFDSGAWDYLVKPFSLAELSARVTACLAKAQVSTTIERKTESLCAKLNHNDLSFNFGGQSMQLHQIGFELLKLLMENAPSTVKTSEIHRRLWPHETPESDPLRANVYKLRKQLTQKFGQSFITTVRGVGYRFVVEPDEGVDNDG